jgi:serine/threonine protein kinase
MDWLDAQTDNPASTSNGERPFETQPSEIKVPSLLGGRYEMESLIAEGGFGQVWRATDTTLLRPVAIKITTVNCISEARRVAQLKHHGIVTVHDVGNSEGLCYIVFDFVDGSTLAEKIRLGSLTIEQSATIVGHVAEFVQFAHDKGFIHRDIKPSNILLDEQGNPVLADFGIAVTECELKHEAMTSLGTLAYMAPEQLQSGATIDVRTDIYALGVVFYELLTGQLPFASPTLSGLRDLILAGNPTPPRTLNPSVPEMYEQICIKCMSTMKDDRYPTAQSLAAALLNPADR